MSPVRDYRQRDGSRDGNRDNMDRDGRDKNNNNNSNNSNNDYRNDILVIRDMLQNMLKDVTGNMRKGEQPSSQEA